jgi:DNA (cytosine-5)-methyltransferase 1
MKSVDLFAGAGGLSCGLSQSGFVPVFANELVPQYAETYQNNHQGTKVVVGDIRQVIDANIKDLIGVKKGEVDLVAGGPTAKDFQ